MTDRLVVSVPEEHLYHALVERFPDIEVVLWDLSGPAPLDKIDVVVAAYMAGVEQFAFLPSPPPRFIQWQSIGYNGLLDAVPPGVTVANAATVHEASTAELTLGLIIAAQREFPYHWRRLQQHDWATTFSPSLADSHVLLLGYGGVGKAIEDRLIPFEVEITRVARSAREGPRGLVHGIDELASLLPRADIFVAALPLSAETTGLIGPAELALLPDGALVVNVGRGPVMSTRAIVAEAGSGRLRFALDVVDPEPLPAGHPLFDLANVLLLPHIGGASSAMPPRIRRLVIDQIERIREGRELRNVISSD